MADAALAIVDEYDDEASRIGKNLRACMLRYHMTVSDLAMSLGISAEQTKQYTDGNIIPEPKILEDMSSVFKISVREICGEEPIASTFGEEIRSIRERAGFTQSDAAEYTGIDNSSLCKIEKGRKRPTWDQVLKLDSCYDDDIKEIARRYGITEPELVNVVKEEKHTLPKVITMDTKKEEVVHKETQESKFKPEWLELIDAIDNDKEFRAVAMYIFKNLFGKGADADFKGMPQASLVGKFIKF